MKTKTLAEKFKEYLASPEGKEQTRKFAQELADSKKILNSQLARFHDKYSDRFEEILNKITAKYDSPEYNNRWLNRSIQPTESLLWFLFEYAEKYGIGVTGDKWHKHANSFTTEMYIVHGYIFSMMQGQGAALQIFKDND